MYNHLNKHLTKNEILFKETIWHSKSALDLKYHSPIVNKTSKAFDGNKFTLGVFIDLGKAFDTVNNKIRISTHDLYSTKGNNLRWFKNYFATWQQFINVDSKTINMEFKICGVCQTFILGPLLFLIFVNISKK